MLLAAWGGALLFLASLGHFAWFYLVRLATPAPAAPASILPALAIDAALFSIFALHHSLFARGGAKAWLAPRLPPGFERSFYVWVASLLFLAVCWLWRPLPGLAWAAPGGWRWVLHAVQLAGVVLTLRSASRIDVWELAGVRQARSTGGEGTRVQSTGVQSTGVQSTKVQSTKVRSTGVAAQSVTVPEASPMLQTDGAYRWVRHPIYLGWVLFVFGVPTMTTSRLVFASISTLYLVLSIPLEERSLTDEFGVAYAAYQRQVRWRLLPGVW